MSGGICDQCHKPFTTKPHSHGKIYCSRQCSERARYARNRARHLAQREAEGDGPQPCVICGAPVPLRRRGASSAQYCGEACRAEGKRMAHIERRRTDYPPEITVHLGTDEVRVRVIVERYRGELLPRPVWHSG